MSSVPKVYYPRILARAMVAEVAGQLWIVPFIPTGWRDRKPYLGHRQGLGTAINEHEAEIQLRTAGWAP